MKNKITSWLKVAIGFQFLTTAVHSLSFIRTPQGKNETEKQMFDLMYNYKMDMGSGFHRSMGQIFTSVSLCFTLIFLLGALINLYLIRAQAPTSLIKGIVGIQVLIFFAVFLGAIFLAFLPPAVFTGLVLLLLTASYFRLNPQS
jgi:hypothetical protein